MKHKILIVLALLLSPAAVACQSDTPKPSFEQTSSNISSTTTVRATREQIRALSQSPLTSYVRDYDRRTVTATY